MRLAGRLAALFALVSGPSLVAFAACDDPEHLPGLANEIPDLLYPNGATGATGAGGASTTSGTGIGTGTGGTDGGATGNPEGGVAVTLCDSAQADTISLAACLSCANTSCASAYSICGTTNFSLGQACVANCNGVGSCIATCLNGNAPYETYVDCLFTSCGSSCGLATPLSGCTLSDAGTD
jgi:hypothetical protein